MQSTKFLPVARKITASAVNFLPIISSSSLRLNLDSYLEPNPRDAVYSHNRAIDNLIKTGHLIDAQKLFDEIPQRDVVSYNLLVSGLAKHGSPKQALFLYQEMVSHGIRETPSTFSSVLGVCSRGGFIREGVQAHCRVVKLGFGLNLYIGSSLVGFYMQMGKCDVGLGLFTEMPERNLAAWNLVLRGFCGVGRCEELLGLFKGMRVEGVEGNGLSFCYLIRGCCEETFLDEGRQVHCLVIKLGWLEGNIFVANALVDFYSACGMLIDARKSFIAIPLGDVISWNSILVVHAGNGLLPEALELFHLMQCWGMKPSIRSYVTLLNLSSKMKDIQLGKQIHGCVLKVGFDGGSVYVQSALIDMYGKCGYIASSISVYQDVPQRTLECCNSLMTSLLYCGIVADVIEIFGLMADGIGLDEVTLLTTLKALSDNTPASLVSCELVHCCAIKSGFESDITVSCSLIDAYSRSGKVQLSLQVFEKLDSPNVICFTSMVNGFSWNGMGKGCLKLLETMIQKGLQPDAVTFLCVLTGCSHCGLVEEGRMVFYSMQALHGISPGREHFSCMVDLLGRAGLLYEAEELLQQAPGRGDYVMWSSLLRSCKVHRNEAVGRRAANVLLQLDPEDFSVYIQISNFYSEIGEFEASRQVREIAIARKLTRDIGHSIIEVNNNY